MNEYEIRAKRIKLEIKAKTIAQDEMEKMQVDSDKKSNFSSISPSNGAIVRGGSGNSNAKGDIKKLVIKNFKSESMRKMFNDKNCFNEIANLSFYGEVITWFFFL